MAECICPPPVSNASTANIARVSIRLPDFGRKMSRYSGSIGLQSQRTRPTTSVLQLIDFLRLYRMANQSSTFSYSFLQATSSVQIPCQYAV